MSTTTVTHALSVVEFDDGQKIYKIEPRGNAALALTPILTNPDNPQMAVTLFDITHQDTDTIALVEIGSLSVSMSAPDAADRLDQFVTVLTRIITAAVTA